MSGQDSAGKGKAKAPASVSGRAGSSTQEASASSGPQQQRAGAGIRAGGIAAELSNLLSSSGKPVGGSRGGGAGSAQLFGAGSALGDALEGPSASSSRANAAPVAAFRQAGSSTNVDPTQAQGQDEAADFFAPPSAGSSRLPDAITPASYVQHPLLRPGAPLSPRLAQYSEALRGPWSTASDLDGQLHAQTRRESQIAAAIHASAAAAATNFSAASEAQARADSWTDEFAAGVPGMDGAALEQAWQLSNGASHERDWAQLDEATQQELLNADWHAAWARDVPAPAFGGPSLAPTAAIGAPYTSTGTEGDFFATLEADEREEEARAIASRANGRGLAYNRPTSADSLTQTAELAQLGIDIRNPRPGLTSGWRPPSPSRPPDVSLEQLLLHRALAAKQEATPDEDPERAMERIKPGNDDERERQGLYAATPEDALQSVWDHQAEAQRVRKEKERRLVEIARARRAGEAIPDARRGEDVEELIREVKTWLPRGSYAEEVHGIPPLLVQTLADAELPADETDPDLVERRLAAIRRLESMRAHLVGRRTPGAGGSAPSPTTLSAAFQRVQLDAPGDR
ncbi:hypothetical protein V8E36_008134 [Tilletia maclaganii]